MQCKSTILVSIAIQLGLTAASFAASTQTVEATKPETVVTGHRLLVATSADIAGESTAAQIASVLPPDENIEWEMYVPPTYDAKRPAGLLVYVSPIQSGEIPRGWSEVLDRHNIIWIGANRSGNSELVARRILLALLATTAARKHYAIDAERIYISGLSGGGKTASMIATDQAQLFRGAIYNCGVEVWDTEEPERLEDMRRNRYVFVTGTYDQALEPTKRAYRAYRRAGVENSKLMVIRHMTHRNPDSYEFEEALQYLDARTVPDP
ncbi:MAG TPA: prolyl oligopeptidase family serine peptidase [Woeseiaceae bacterium]|nr:prolyl oligopeptidase family serine peptidase [Woeseiaceae bacterium]